MAEVTIKQIGDRMNSINDTITGSVTLNAYRYHPGLNTAKMPFVIPAHRGFQHVAQGDEGNAFPLVRHTFQNEMWCGALLQGVPGQSVIVIAEEFTQAMLDAYQKRPRLELNGNDPLDGLADLIDLQGATVSPAGEYLVVRFQIIVPTHSKVTNI